MDEDLPDELLFDDDARRISNAAISAVIEAFSGGDKPIPEADAIAFACDVLMMMADCEDDVDGIDIVMLLSSSKGVTFSKIVPKLSVFQKRMNQAIDNVRATRRQVQDQQATRYDDIF